MDVNVLDWREVILWLGSGAGMSFIAVYISDLLRNMGEAPTAFKGLIGKIAVWYAGQGPANKQALFVGSSSTVVVAAILIAHLTGLNVISSFDQVWSLGVTLALALGVGVARYDKKSS